MALSGSFYKNVASRWRVYVSWSGSQSISGNYTDITMKVYWQSLDSYGTTYTSTTKSGSSTIEGTSESFSFSAKLSGKESKLVKTQTKRINHADTGKFTDLDLSASLDIELTLDGTYYGTVTVSDSVDLNTIPRASSMSTSASWTAGSNRTINISSASNSFRHEVEIYVKRTDGVYDWVGQVAFSAGDTSQSTDFTTTQHTEIFQHLAQRASADVKMDLQTFDGSTHIGSKEYFGTVTAPEATLASIDNPTNVSTASGQGHSTVYIDQTITLSLPRKHGSFTHTVRFKDGNGGNTLKTFTGVETSVSWTPTATEQNTMYAKTPNSIEFDGQIEVDTYYNGQKVRSTRETDINYRVRNAEPTFSASQVTYKDINSTTVTMTGNDQLIVQGKSTFRAWINSVATAQKGASIAKYILTINGQTASVNVSGTTDGVGYYNFPNPIDAGSDQILTVKVVDSRGFETSVTKNVTVVPYFEPSLAVKVERVNSFEATTNLTANGNYANVGGSNTVTKVQYRYKEKGLASWTVDWTNMTITASNGSVSADSVSFELVNTKEYEFEVKVIDELSERTYYALVGAGQPVFFFDPIKRSLGFNDFPLYDGEFRVNGRIVFGSNMWASNAQGEGAGALFLNNSDITGVNGVWFNDDSNNNGEGLLFKKSGADGSTNQSDYYSWRIGSDGIMSVDGSRMMVLDSSGVRNYYISDGTNNMELISTVAGESHGIGVTIQAGGAMYVGSGESAKTMANGLGWTGSTEQTFITSDNNVFVTTNLNGGYGGRHSFEFTNGGHLNVPYQVNSGSNLRMNGYNTIENLNDRLYLDGKTGVSIRNLNSGGAGTVIELNNDGSPLVQSMAIYNRTYSGSANMYITGYGTLGRSTSAKKYKTDIKEISTDSYAEKLLQLKPKSWVDKNESYRYFAKKRGKKNIEAPLHVGRHIGLVAEDLEEVGLSEYVTYVELEEGKKEVEGLAYDRLWTLLIPIVQKQQERIESLEKQLGVK